MSKEYLSAEVSDDSKLWSEFESWQQAEGFESKSEAVREAVRRGLDEDGDTNEEPVGIFAAGLSGLADESYELVRDSLLLAAAALVLQVMATSVGVGRLDVVVSALVVVLLGVALIAMSGAVAGVYIRARDVLLSDDAHPQDETADSPEGVDG